MKIAHTHYGEKNLKKDEKNRNPWCPIYEKCLDVAARADTNLTCNGCSYRDLARVAPSFKLEPGDLRGALLLMRAVFSGQVDEDHDWL